MTALRGGLKISSSGHYTCDLLVVVTEACAERRGPGSSVSWGWTPSAWRSAWCPWAAFAGRGRHTRSLTVMPGHLWARGSTQHPGAPPSRRAQDSPRPPPVLPGHVCISRDVDSHPRTRPGARASAGCPSREPAQGPQGRPGAGTSPVSAEQSGRGRTGPRGHR